MESLTGSSETTPIETELQLLADLTLGDCIAVRTDSGSTYEFSIAEYVDIPDYPEQSFIRAQLRRQSDHEVDDDADMSWVKLEGSCTGAIMWGTASIAMGGSSHPDISVGK